MRQRYLGRVPLCLRSENTQGKLRTLTKLRFHVGFRAASYTANVSRVRTFRMPPCYRSHNGVGGLGTLAGNVQFSVSRILLDSGSLAAICGLQPCYW